MLFLNLDLKREKFNFHRQIIIKVGKVIKRQFVFQILILNFLLFDGCDNTYEQIFRF